ncbi:RecQ family ATP-dependent DNA helicase [Brachybacterium nesterenkovii]|uniref:DNA 3'-5' helicase n=1 Tax=Brachybacterium nesterenkovii TaxID=47847 RepID=A0A1X6X3Y6_9MICO|nr:DEAD/DEAH box helicase [Brachybacterium nesterenkovii]SLM92636.1 ATP-dependent DNA helicase RecQ [Brachybacterium nesterenkovii]
MDITRPPASPSPASGASGDLHAEALEALRALTGRADAQFHPGQFEAIEALVAERRRALVVQRTGWGKSAVYFLAALLQRRRGAGPALIVSPLLALMRDQVAAASRAGVRAEAINSANPTEWALIEQRLAADDVDVLLVSPERLVNPRFRDEQLPRLIGRCGLLVIDEAHCISDWGHDFRPDYRRLRDLVATLGPGVPVLATTATANGRVVADVAEQLGTDGSEVLTLRGPLTRDSLRLGCLSLPDDRSRLEYLVRHLDEFEGSGIIYTLTVSAAQDLAQLLDRPGRRVRAYTGRTDSQERAELEQALKDNEVKALAATSALGMGFDKPDLGFVIHLGAPSSPVAYYQQVGRAGRATDTADVLLLPGKEDRRIWEYFATASMPSEESARAVLDALARAEGPLSTPALEARVDVKRSALELLLKVLAVDGALEAVRGGWVSTGAPWTYDAERYANVARTRREEQDAMLAYERLGSGGRGPEAVAADPEQCRMVFLARRLDDATATPCGRCDVCASAWYPEHGAAGGSNGADGAPDGAGSEVAALLQRVGVPVEPRAQWPQGLDRLRLPALEGPAPKGRIPEGERAETGHALARLSDLGWGTRLREVLATDADGRPVDSLVPADLGGRIVEVLKEWDWAQRPAAVVAVPSTTRPQLVRSLAQGIATVGRLEDLGALDLAPDAQPLRSGGNSAFRVADLWARFTVGPQLAERLRALDGAPILLVDDRIDSRWTMTIAARALRRAGAGPVLPLALALKG